MIFSALCGALIVALLVFHGVAQSLYRRSGRRSSASSACPIFAAGAIAQAAHQQIRRRISQRDRHHRARRQGGPPARGLHAHHRQRSGRAGARRIPVDRRNAGDGPVARRGRRQSSPSGCRSRKPIFSRSSSTSRRRPAAICRRRWAIFPACLRERKKMKGKIGAMSMEAKASAAIIGAVPFVVVGLLYAVEPRLCQSALDDDAWHDRLRRRHGLDGDRHRDDEEDDHFRLLNGREAMLDLLIAKLSDGHFVAGILVALRLRGDDIDRSDAAASDRQSRPPHESGEHRERKACANANANAWRSPRTRRTLRVAPKRLVQGCRRPVESGELARHR